MAEEKYVPSKEAEAILDGYRLLDDNFMTIFFDQNYAAVTLVLNIVLNRTDLQIKSIQVQKTEKSPVPEGRNVVLDVFAADADGKNYDIEIQRSDFGADRKRARFLSGVLDSRMLKSGEDFSKLNESYVIFITEHDVIGTGLPMVHIERTITELQECFNDGNHMIYVNGAYKNDSSDIGRLMHDFRCTSSVDMFYDVLKNGMVHFKETEGGREAVCKAIETYGEQKEMLGVVRLGRKLGWSEERIADELMEMFKISAETAKKLLAPNVA